MSSLQPKLEEHFCTKVLACASRLQSASPTAGSLSDPGTMSTSTADQFAEELLQCIQGLSAPQVERLKEYTCMLGTLHTIFFLFFFFADSYIF